MKSRKNPLSIGLVSAIFAIISFSVIGLASGGK